MQRIVVNTAGVLGVGVFMYDCLQGEQGYIWPSIKSLFGWDPQTAPKLPSKKVLVLGLIGAGKSTILSGIGSAYGGSGDCGVSIKEQQPTEGSKVVTVCHDGRPLEIREIGGNELMRKYWSEFYDNVDLLVFVIDSGSSMKDRETAYILMRETVTHQKLVHVPLLVIANKQDADCSLEPETLIEDSKIKALVPLRSLTYVGCSIHENTRAKVQNLILALV